ncbi:MAG TPA: hypothetical protein VF454_01470 [Gemmatimonadales bacterium]
MASFASPTPAPPSIARKQFPWTIAGVIAALVLGEAAIRPFGGPRVYPEVSIAEDRGSLRALERREYAEGIAVSHFSVGNERALGVPAPVGGPPLVLLGDSHVEALEVGDAEVMGTELQRLLNARIAGSGVLPPVVREYGRSSAGIATYLLVAPEIRTRIAPNWVVVTLVDNDFNDDMFSGTVRMVREPEGWHAEGRDPWLQVPPEAGSLRRRIGDAVVARSALLYRLGMRGVAVVHSWTSPVPPVTGLPPVDERAALAVSQLSDAYGGALRILFIADVGLDGTPATPAEEAVLRHCARLGVRCASTRDAMLELRRDSLEVSRGFYNTVPGIGHLNPAGHRATARAIADRLIP